MSQNENLPHVNNLRPQSSIKCDHFDKNDKKQVNYRMDNFAEWMVFAKKRPNLEMIWTEAPIVVVLTIVLLLIVCNIYRKLVSRNEKDEMERDENDLLPRYVDLGLPAVVVGFTLSPPPKYNEIVFNKISTC